MVERYYTFIIHKYNKRHVNNYLIITILHKQLNKYYNFNVKK